jgi:hypothetical protein
LDPSVPIFPILGLLLSMAIIARALLGGVYRGQRSVGGRSVGRVLLVFGVAMWVVFLVRIIQWYRVR